MMQEKVRVSRLVDAGCLAMRGAVLLLGLGLLWIQPAVGATVSLKAFDRMAQTVELEYIRSGAREIQRVPMERKIVGVWQADFSVPAGNYEYRFVTDGEWISDISNPAFNRWDDGSVWSMFSVPGEQDSFLNYRAPAGDIGKPGQGDFSNAVEESEAIMDEELPENLGDRIVVTFQFYAPLASEVAVVGTFNDWNGDANKLLRRGGLWKCVIPLPEGIYEYKFKVDGNWFWDPDQPPQAPGGNSVLTVKRPTSTTSTALPLIQPEEWKDSAQILLEPATGLHAFQQELMRAYIYIAGSDQHHLKIADGSLLNPDNLPVRPTARWGWTMDRSDGRSMMVLTVQSNTTAFELKHPLLDSPEKWLMEQRLQAEKAVGDVTLDLSGPKSPPPGSAWAEARTELEKRLPFSDVYAVNRMTEFGRKEGWSRELLQELAMAYADMSLDYRHPGVGGWAPMVFAARAVVYADLARAGNSTDETLAYVLCRIGRPGDGAAFLPTEPETFHGWLAAAMSRGELEPLLQWAGSSDHYGLKLSKGQTSRPSAMEEFTASQKARILSILSDLLARDGQDNLSRCYLNGSLKYAPRDFSNLVRALDRGDDVRVGDVLKLSGCPKLWKNVLQGMPPVLCSEEKSKGYYAVFSPMTSRDSDEEGIAEISSLYQESQYKLLDCVSNPVPQSARLLLLRDMLNTAWWHNAKSFGENYSKRECQRLNQLMATWKPLQPEMESFTRFKMTHAMDDHEYGLIQRTFTDSPRKPDTLDYIRMVRSSFQTWLMDKAQSFYPLVLTVQSDLYADYPTSKDVYVFQHMDLVRLNCRRLDPQSPYGYPAPGPLPKFGMPCGIPEAIFHQSFALNRRLAEEWGRTFDKESQEQAMAFFKRCIELAPNEVDTYCQYAEIMLDNGRAQEVISLAESCPDIMKDSDRAELYQMGAFAALESGDIPRALDLAKEASDLGNFNSMLLYAYVLEISGDFDEAKKIYSRFGEFRDRYEIYLLARQMPDKAEEMATEIFSWLEQFSDLDQANREGRFSFNAIMDEPYIYASLDRWDRALWLFKPLAEGVQNDFIWFGLMMVGQKTGDKAAMELGQHVLATHVFNAWGDFARYMRNQTTWEEVLNSARINHTPQPMYYLAAVMAEQRGDSALAVRLYKQTLDPRFTTGPWFTMAWRALKRLGNDPMAFVRRNVSVQQVLEQQTGGE